ncbi:MAG: hypothetical protein ISS25_03750 [Nanoarchaeota archaeon]|nr:hypothetical protein [DPANN group archaeon]MBL7116917.1 hypothetical protein [Nanoarchaeota archaeon]
MKYAKKQYVLAFVRIGLGWIFLWAFLDKVFGLGFATEAESAWLAGGSPTAGFLQFGTAGPFASVFQGLAGSAFVEWLFMIGLLLIGLALIFGMGVKIAGYTGALLMLLMWLAVLPPEHNPILDDHIIYGLILIGLTFVKSGHWLGLGKWWSGTELVKKHSFLE